MINQISRIDRECLASERTYLAWWRSILAAFGIAFIGYDFRRQQVMERALLQGHFVPFDRRAALWLHARGRGAGIATLVVIVV
jgi:uncharacterized membrane protein YidH (DUF202 family)